MVGDNGEPIRVPNICWYMVCWKVKEVELKQMSNAFINSGTLNVVRSSEWESLLTLSNRICFACSSGMLVNRLMTSNDTCFCESLILKSLIRKSLIRKSWLWFPPYVQNLTEPIKRVLQQVGVGVTMKGPRLFGAALFGAIILCFLLTLTQSPNPNPNPN